MKCFYHIDEDGKCSAFWVNKLARHYDGYEKKFVPINYGVEFPFETIQPDEQVYIVDYSIFPEEMEKLLKITSDITWIDHHASAIKRYDNFPHNIKGIRYDGIAGCMLTYCYLTHMYSNGFLTGARFEEWMTEDAPMFTKYIADFDVWKFEYGDDTRAFEMGLQLYDSDPIAEDKDNIFEAMLIWGCEVERNVISRGRDLLIYRDNWAKEYCRHIGFETEFEGYKCFAMNLAMISSDHFKSVNEEEYDMFIGFSYNGKTWNYSLRSTKVDCSQIAMKYGGGGHKGAAGFNTDRLLLKAKEEWCLSTKDMLKLYNELIKKES